MYESDFQFVHLLGFSTLWSLLWSFILFTKVPKWWLCLNILKPVRLWVENFFLYKLSQVFHHSEKRLANKSLGKGFYMVLVFQPVRFFQSLRSWSMEIDLKRSVLPSRGREEADISGYVTIRCDSLIWKEKEVDFSFAKGQYANVSVLRPIQCQI